MGVYVYALASKGQHTHKPCGVANTLADGAPGYGRVAHLAHPARLTFEANIVGRGLEEWSTHTHKGWRGRIVLARAQALYAINR